ncbi:sulfatase [Pelagibius sp. Alg239-R121]|uniref:sulfatase n=1 Tax=Pelagibius sp. Alg239-R121 TaxID=2993448 RepID=UPI0024A79FD6|nr:sulfatase [Pelagibius sp. Alg239-R121]
MKTVFVFLDSLNRNAMEPYGSEQVYTPNFSRFAERAVTFDNHYVGSLPCIPARRDLHSGRINFLHRSWGPLEPFDDSFPEILKQAGTYTHIVTDHHHYFADGGATYHQRYASWELVRGQAIDRWKAHVKPDLEAMRADYHPLQHHRVNYMTNRQYVTREEDYCGPQVFGLAQQFLDKNHDCDDWLLQVECFDPHEPFHAPPRFREMYPTSYDGPILDWPFYERVRETPEEIAELRANYAALTSMCDEYFGRLLDFFDEKDLWKDTCLILTTDHGFLLGEHDWWSKNRMPVYDEIARIPLMIYHPAWAGQGGTRRQSLTQATDIMPTILDLHGQNIPGDVLGKSLLPLMAGDRALREAAIFGYFGAACNVTDGRYVYFRYPERFTAEDLYEYTLMPTRMTSRFAISELVGATLANPFSFSKGVPLLKLRPRAGEKGNPVEVQGMNFEDTQTRLYDLGADPHQENPLDDPETEQRLISAMTQLMREADAPDELFARFNLDPV